VCYISSEELFLKASYQNLRVFMQQASTTSYDPDNLFAKILRKEIPSKEIFSNEYAYAFEDIQPEAPVHVLVIPRGEYTSFDDFIAKADAAFVKGFFASVRSVAHQLGLPENGYRIITNHGKDASQTVFHFHVHILGGKPLGKLLGS
jgi:diadenosine tetraphosphate (Ap4A) HIT family hydrolase